MATTQNKSRSKSREQSPSQSSSRSRGRRTASKDAIGVLKEDHEKVKELLSQLERTTTRSAGKRGTLLEKIAQEVRVHARIEEEIFYPAFSEAGESSDDEKIGYEAKEEHGLVDIVLPELEATDASTELFSARAKVLKDLIEHHIREEERSMFPRAKKLIERERMMELAERLTSRKEDLRESELGGDGRARGRLGERLEQRMQSSRAALQGEGEESDLEEDEESEGEDGESSGGERMAERVRSSRAGMGSSRRGPSR